MQTIVSSYSQLRWLCLLNRTESYVRITQKNLWFVFDMHLIKAYVYTADVRYG